MAAPTRCIHRPDDEHQQYQTQLQMNSARVRSIGLMTRTFVHHPILVGHLLKSPSVAQNLRASFCPAS